MEIGLRSICSYSIIAESDKMFELFKLINDNSLIDRLYKRYVNRRENIQTLNLIESKSKQNPISLLNDLVLKFRNEISHAEYFYSEFGKYIPIRLVICDMPYPLIEEEIPLEDYDNLEGAPLWMRPEYMLEKYGK